MPRKYQRDIDVNERNVSAKRKQRGLLNVKSTDIVYIKISFKPCHSEE